MKRTHVWIVEMWCQQFWHSSFRGIWVPTVSVGLTHKEAARNKSIWKLHNPDDTFRVRRYVRGGSNA